MHIHSTPHHSARRLALPSCGIRPPSLAKRLRAGGVFRFPLPRSLPARTASDLTARGEKVMASHNQKGRSKKRGQYMPIPYVMAHSPAWRSLHGNAVKVYVELRSRYNGKNNGDLSLSLGEAQKLLGMGKSSAARAFEELQDKGFIWKTSSGHWYGRKAATYAVTDQPFDGHPATNAWQNWHKRNSEKNRTRSSRGTLDGVASRLGTGNQI